MTRRTGGAEEYVGRLTAHATLLKKMGHTQMADDIWVACELLVDEFARDAEHRNFLARLRKQRRKAKLDERSEQTQT